MSILLSFQILTFSPLCGPPTALVAEWYKQLPMGLRKRAVSSHFFRNAFKRRNKLFSGWEYNFWRIKFLLIYSDAGEQFYTGTQENCLSPSVKLLSSIPIDQQIFDKFDSSKMGLLSGKTFVSPLKPISKKIWPLTTFFLRPIGSCCYHSAPKWMKTNHFQKWRWH